MTEPDSPATSDASAATSGTLQLGGVGAVLLGLLQLGLAVIVVRSGAPPDESGVGDLLRRAMTSSAALLLALGLYLLIGGCVVASAPPLVARRAWPWVWPAFIVVVLMWFFG